MVNFQSLLSGSLRASRSAVSFAGGADAALLSANANFDSTEAPSPGAIRRTAPQHVASAGPGFAEVFSWERLRAMFLVPLFPSRAPQATSSRSQIW